MAKLLLYIKADTNDADYITSLTEVTIEQLEALRPVFEALKGYNERGVKGDHENWPRSNWSDSCVEDLYEGILTQEQITMFDELCPSGEDGFHYIAEIRLFTVTEDTEIFQQKFS